MIAVVKRCISCDAKNTDPFRFTNNSKLFPGRKNIFSGASGLQNFIFKTAGKLKMLRNVRRIL